MQYERGEGPGKSGYPILGELPRRNIDTGMGLERMATLLQGVDNLYEIDEIRPVLDRAAALAEVRYGADAEADVRLRVVADHVRTALMLLADGTSPGNEGRGYVLRRAVRSPRQLGRPEPVLVDLLAVARDCMAPSHPEVAESYDRIADRAASEEEAFRSTLRQGTTVLDTAVAKVKAEGGRALRRDLPVGVRWMTLSEARELGALALFDETYGEKVRVVEIGGAWSRELCGGTHVEHASQIGTVALTSESSVGAGMRRLEAAVGAEGFGYLARERGLVSRVAEQLQAPRAELPDRVAGLGDPARRRHRNRRAGQPVLPMPRVVSRGSMPESRTSSQGRPRSSASFAVSLSPRVCQGAAASSSVRRSTSARRARHASVAVWSAFRSPRARSRSRAAVHSCSFQPRLAKTSAEAAPMAANDTSASTESRPVVRRAARWPSPRCSRRIVAACHSTRCGSWGQGSPALAAASGRPSVRTASAARRASAAASATSGPSVHAPKRARYARSMPRIRAWTTLSGAATSQAAGMCSATRRGLKL